MVTNDQIREIVDEELSKNLLEINDFEAYKVTAGIPNEGIRKLVMFDWMILHWIRQIIDSNKSIATPDNKVRMIKEIFNAVDEMEEI